VRDDGRPADALALRYAMQVLCRRLGWGVRGDYPYHRLHDHRHNSGTPIIPPMGEKCAYIPENRVIGGA
jgi:hypothetical protein